MSARTWPAARRYVLPPLAAGVVLLPLRPRAGAALIGVAGGLLAFFRDPSRPLEPEPGVVYAPADGFLKAVDEVDEPELPGGRALRVSTFLSVHNVHVNRSPVAGTVADIRQLPGGHAPALFGTATENTRTRITLDTPDGPVILVLMAGALARRIDVWVTVGEWVDPGHRLGLIHFGSRTDVLLPAGSARPLVRPGDRMRAGRTPLASRLPPPSPWATSSPLPT